MNNKKTTPKEQKKTFEEEFTLKKNEQQIVEFRPSDAVIFYPALCNPAVVKKEGTKATLELLVLSENKNLQRGDAAFHLRHSVWDDKDKPSTYHRDAIWKNYIKDKESVVVSKSYLINEKTFGEGDSSPDAEEDDGFTLKLGHLNIFPWTIEKGKDYKYIYKIAVKLNYISTGMHNIRWVTYHDYHKTYNKTNWWNLIQHVKDFFSEDHKKELKEYGKVDDKDNIKASPYHPFYISTKEELNIGHITDVHLDTRMDLYGQCAASALEVEENCKDGVSFDEKDKRVINASHLCKPLSNVVANFNKSFMEISGKLLSNSDILVITGDLIDYNKGIHTDQTQKPKGKKPGDVWEDLEAGTFSFDTKNNKKDRNWFMFYKYLLELYDTYDKPIFTMLGNHDYVEHATAPWPFFGILWNGVYDMNLTLYENALCYGPSFSDDKEFFGNAATSIDFVKWYTFYINPFADFVVNYGDQTLFMVDWGEEGNTKMPKVTGKGGLHQADNLFSEQADFNTSGNHKYNSSQPYPIKNYSIYKSWINSKPQIKMLFMHATAICPKDDVSTGEAVFDLKWTDSKLQFGTFAFRRKEIIKDIEQGKLHIVLTGHSHRNMLFEVKEGCNHYPLPIGSEEMINTDFMEPANLVLITSSGGPLPKYLPGGPKICGCQRNNKYNTGFFVEGLPGFRKLYQYKGDINPDSSYLINSKSKIRGTHLKSYIEQGICPDCGMKAGDMEDKKPRRHRPGGNLLLFNNGKVKVRTELSDMHPRKAVMCEEQDVFVGDMVVEAEEDYAESRKTDWVKTLNITSQKPFDYFGYMEFPSQVEYITYKKPKTKSKGTVEKLMRGGNPHRVEMIPAEDNKHKIKQGIGKKELDVLKDIAGDRKDFIFTRYRFGENELWDREIEIGGYYAQDPEVIKIRERDAKYVRKLPSQKEKFTIKKNVIIGFVTTPDFDKRRDVCGY